MKDWMKKLYLPCAVVGGLCLLGMVFAVRGLGQGGWVDRLGVAAVLLAFAG